MIYPSDLPLKILSDEGKITQILSNLIGNALKFTEKGKIEVKSRSGRGSSFFFSFPYSPLKQEVVQDKGQAETQPEIRQKTKKNINILIAEDDDFSYYIIDRFLKDYTTTRAKDGKDVLEKKIPTFLLLLSPPKLCGVMQKGVLRRAVVIISPNP